MSTNTNAIELRGVSKSYGRTRAVTGLDLALKPGETVALLGANGAGKSTLIGMTLGLIAPDEGEISVMGTTPARAVSSGRITGMLQDAGFMPGVRVGELIQLSERAYPHSMPAKEAVQLAGLTDVVKRRVDRLSGGQAQRLRFASAIVGLPEILLLDEPTTAMDVSARARFWAAMRAYAANGRTVVFATHYLEEVEDNADRVIVLASGRIVADGAPAQVRGHAGPSRVRFRLDADAHGGADSDAVERELAALSNVVGRDVRGSQITLTTTDADTLVRQLAMSALPWRGVEIAPPSFDDTFLTLIGESANQVQEHS